MAPPMRCAIARASCAPLTACVPTPAVRWGRANRGRPSGLSVARLGIRLPHWRQRFRRDHEAHHVPRENRRRRYSDRRPLTARTPRSRNRGPLARAAFDRPPHRVRAEFHSRFVTPGDRKPLVAKLAGRSIVGVRRRGKFIVIALDQGTLAVHLGMTGKLLMDGAHAAHTRHFHARRRHAAVRRPAPVRPHRMESVAHRSLGPGASRNHS